MTATLEDTKPDTKAADVDDDDDDSDEDGNEKVDGRKNRERDFSKVSKSHEEIAEFVNADAKFQEAKIAPVTANQVKAILALRTDWNNTPEKIAEREAKKKEREEQAKKYEGLSKEQIAAEKAAERAEKQALKLQERVQAALAKAAAIREGKDASGEDVAAAVEASQNGSAETTSEPKRTIGRGKSAAK